MTLLNKITSLYFPPHNFVRYEEILSVANDAGYSIISLDQFVEGEYREPFMILRHDIDTDPKAALLFAEIESRYRAGASYFFRLCTWNDKVIKALDHRGFEIGYHYEESTTYAKRHHIKSGNELKCHFPEIRKDFARNLSELRRRSGLRLEAIASHGDIATVVLDLGNEEAMLDSAIREACGIKYEAYDPPIWDGYKNHLSDNRYPPYFKPESPLELISRGESFLFLTHPRWWRCDLGSNLKTDLRMLWQKLRY